ncbi:MAG: GNAT family N-acetyltransferase [Actinomycetota bacterium]
MGELVIQIRPAQPHEAEALFLVQRSSALAGFAHIFDPVEHPFPDAAERARWTAQINSPHIDVLVAESDDAPVGVAVVEADNLERLFVAPERWGMGVGSLLHDAVIELVRQKGRTRCQLWVLTENSQARAFYEKRGWKLDGRTRHAHFPPFPPAVGYTLDLAE